jgi:hypothetical protein
VAAPTLYEARNALEDILSECDLTREAAEILIRRRDGEVFAGATVATQINRLIHEACRVPEKLVALADDVRKYQPGLADAVDSWWKIYEPVLNSDTASDSRRQEAYGGSKEADRMSQQNSWEDRARTLVSMIANLTADYRRIFLTDAYLDHRGLGGLRDELFCSTEPLAQLRQAQDFPDGNWIGLRARAS